MTGEAGAAPAVYFLSDYGAADEFVGVVHAVLHRLAPQAPVIDLGHQVRPFDVAAGAAMLVRCAPYLGPGVVLAVVDPGVGTARRAVAIGLGGAAGKEAPSWLVGPDNGLLVPLADSYGDIESVVVIDRNGPALPARGPAGAGAPSSTFDGRDVFAPAAAHILRGGDPVALGSLADPGSLIPADVGRTPAPDPGPGHDPGRAAQPDAGVPAILTRVESVDRFGNVQTHAGPSAADELGIRIGDACRVAVEPLVGRAFPTRRVTAFDELDEGELGVLVDSSGHLALVLRRASAAGMLGPLRAGDRIRITAWTEAG